MGYSVKWVWDNLGISRKALRILEDKRYKLMPENENRNYRDYSEEDLQRIWMIKTLQGIGYSLQEISDLQYQVEDENFDFQDSITKKIKDLEKEIEIKNQHLGYAKAIKLSGKIPTISETAKYMKFEDFQKKVLEEWNINDEPELLLFQDVADSYATLPSFDSITEGNITEGNITEEQFLQLMNMFCNIDFSQFTSPSVLPATQLEKVISQKKALGGNNPEIQVLVKVYREYYEKTTYEANGICRTKDFTPRDFANYILPTYLMGDFAKVKEHDLGKEGYKFVADAIAIYGGYRDSDEFLSL